MSATILVEKSGDKLGAIIGDIITYTIKLTNTGNTSANSVIFSDKIPEGMSFLPDSFSINGQNYSGVNPSAQIGIAIGNINSGEIWTISFKAIVDSMPNPNILSNTATVKFKYTEDPAVPNGVSQTVNSNIVNTTISTLGAEINHTSDIMEGTIGDTITYTVSLRNTGNIQLNNVLLIDTLPKETTFISNSVRINGTNELGKNPSPPTGIIIGNIIPGNVVTVDYQVLVNTIPKLNPIMNKAYVKYDYIIDPANPNRIVKSLTSNTTNINIGQAVLVASKTVDKKGATLGDNINYKVVIKNLGNISADNVIVIDTIPSGVSFMVNSLMADGVMYPGETTDYPGFNLGSIFADETVTISFSVLADTLPQQNNISNSALVTYNYTTNQNNPNGKSGRVNTNSVTTAVGKAILTSQQSVNKSLVTIGENIRYTLNINNSGNIPANNVKVNYTLPKGTNFVNNSLTINNIVVLGENPNESKGVIIDSIKERQSAVLSFEVTVVSMPNPNTIKNSAQIGYVYTVNPDAINGVFDFIKSNEVVTNVADGVLTSMGYANRKAVEVGGRINYGVVLKNTGNIPLENVKFTNTIPSGTLYYPQSVKKSGVSFVDDDPTPPVGIQIGNIDTGEVFTINFEVVVTTLPSPNLILNSSTTNYGFRINSNIPNEYTRSTNANIVSVNVNQAILKFQKLIDKDGIRPNDKQTVSLVLTNTGNVDTGNIVLLDTIPQGLILENNSVKVNNVPQLGESPQPPIGMIIPRILKGNTMTITYNVLSTDLLIENITPNIATVAFEYTADPSIPNGAMGSSNSNGVTFNIRKAILTTDKMVDKVNATVGDTLTYSVIINNTGNIAAENVLYFETLPMGVELINNSIQVNGGTQAVATTARPRGISLGRIEAGDSSRVDFSVAINRALDIDTISSIGTVVYEYSVGTTRNSRFSEFIDTSVVITKVNKAVINFNDSGGLFKSTDKPFAALNEVITYNTEVRNIGNVSAINVVYIDTIPSSLTFIENSLIVDGNIQYGVNPLPPFGINIGEIGANEIAKISYKAIVNTIPSPKVITTGGLIRYNYVIDSVSGRSTSAIGSTNLVTNTINYALISNNDGGLIKKVNMQKAGVGSILTYTIELKNTGNIPAYNVVFKDSIPTETSFVQRSVVLDNIARLTMDPYKGIPIDAINPGEKRTISFNVKVNNLGTYKPISNLGIVDYDFVVDTNANKIRHSSNLTNIVTTDIGGAIISNQNGGFIKTVDKKYSNIGDIVKYTVVLTNKGNMPAINVIFYDTIPRNTEFVTNSTMINGEVRLGMSPNSGIQVGDINPNVPVTVSYSVLVKSLDRNNNNKIINNSEVYYDNVF